MTGLRNSAVCRMCLMAYTTVMFVLSASYLYQNWGVHSSYASVRQELLDQSDGGTSIEGLAFTESGGAEYVLVCLYSGFHLLILALLLCGRRRNTVMGVACALLLACSMMYILFYGCIALQARMEQYHSLTAPGGAPLRKPEAPAPYKLTAQDVDRTIASTSAGAEGVVEQAPPGQEAAGGGGSCQSGRNSDEPLSYANLLWTVLETLVDVLAAIVAGPEGEMDGEPMVQRYHRDGVPIDPTAAPFDSLRRVSLLGMSLVGFVLSIWGITTFDMSTEGVAQAANPGLTASALSQLSSGAATAERSEERRRQRVAAALQADAPPATTAKAAKKKQ